MSNIPEVAQARHRLLTDVSGQAASATGLVQRRSRLTGPGFAQTLVLGWLANPEASLAARIRTAAVLGAPVSPQARFRRFTPRRRNVNTKSCRRRCPR